MMSFGAVFCSYALMDKHILPFLISVYFVVTSFPLRSSSFTAVMGGSSSIVSAFTASTSDTDRQPSQRKNKKQHRTDRKEWKEMVDRFHQQVLDPSYVQLPIRFNTVQSALQYPADTNYLMPGSHKHLGGAFDPADGCIYGVPANSKSVMCLYLDPDCNEYRMKHIPLPPRVAPSRFKWLRGIFAHGYLWAIPSWADCVLCVDVDGYWGRRELQGDVVELIDLPTEHKMSTWQWHGAGINPAKTAIYCIPSNAAHVLKVDLLKRTTSFISIDFDPVIYPDFSLEHTNKWYGGIPGNDGCVYGIPYRASAVLQINTFNDSARLIGPNYGVQKYFWHGGINVSGFIYAHPSHANTVLMIDTNHEADRADIQELSIDFNSEERSSTIAKQTYKWLGGAVGVDGHIYCPACDTTAVLQINTETKICKTFGFAGESRNKWQGGVLSPRDGCIYCIPASGEQVLRISTSTSPPTLQLIGNLPVHKDKWQGGHLGLDGNLYFVPENGCRVLKVIPPLEPPQLIKGQLPVNDVRLEFL